MVHEGRACEGKHVGAIAREEGRGRGGDSKQTRGVLGAHSRTHTLSHSPTRTITHGAAVRRRRRRREINDHAPCPGGTPR